MPGPYSCENVFRPGAWPSRRLMLPAGAQIFHFLPPGLQLLRGHLEGVDVGDAGAGALQPDILVEDHHLVIVAGPDENQGVCGRSIDGRLDARSSPKNIDS